MCGASIKSADLGNDKTPDRHLEILISLLQLLLRREEPLGWFIYSDKQVKGPNDLKMCYLTKWTVATIHHRSQIWIVMKTLGRCSLPPSLHYAALLSDSSLSTLARGYISRFDATRCIRWYLAAFRRRCSANQEILITRKDAIPCPRWQKWVH